MVKMLLVVNGLLTLPFGIAALAMPTALFAQFGLQLDAGGSLIARGYGATLVAYGLVLLLMRATIDAGTVTVLLSSMALFNAIEAIIQGIAGMEAVAQPVIFCDRGDARGFVCCLSCRSFGTDTMSPASPARCV
jgi:hypothetical protein